MNKCFATLKIAGIQSFIGNDLDPQTFVLHSFEYHSLCAVLDRLILGESLNFIAIVDHLLFSVSVAVVSKSVVNSFADDSWVF